MVLFWFVLALVLLVVALVLLRMDAKQRRGASARSRVEGKDGARASGTGPEGGVADVDAPGGSDDDNSPHDDKTRHDDKAPHAAVPAGIAAATSGAASGADTDSSAESVDEPAGDPGAPKLAPFQRATRAGDASEADAYEADAGRDISTDIPTAAVAGAGSATAVGRPPVSISPTDTGTENSTDAEADNVTGKSTDDSTDSGTGSTNTDSANTDSTNTASSNTTSTSTDPATAGPIAAAGVAAGAGALAVGAAVAGNDSDSADSGSADDAAELDTEPDTAHDTEPDTGSSPRLLDRVRALLPARKSAGRARAGAASGAGSGAGAGASSEPVDPLAGSPIVRWLEDREFAPTQTPAPEFRHGDFALGLSALGTVSHGVFRGRRAIMGVSGGRTVLALRRDTASDMVLDLSRPDVDAEPGFHDAGQVGALEARTSDYGRLDLIDRDRLIDAIDEVPADVRRIWAEGEWVAATIDGVDDPGTWDDVVMALHAAADVLAPFPPIGGRARALPAEMDPGAPASADGPDADPTLGMDGAAGAASVGAAGAVGAAATGAASVGTAGVANPATAPRPESGDVVVVDTPTATDQTTATGTPTASPADVRPEPTPTSTPTQTPTQTPSAAPSPTTPPRRTGHLRLVPDRSARDLHDVPVVADRGDAEEAGAEPAASDQAATDATTPDQAATGQSTTDQTATDQPASEPDPFAEIMEQSAPVASRGDVAADHLAPRPPLSRPTRGVGQSFPEDASVPPLAAGVATGAAGIKPLGSEDDQDEIRDEVERFDAARIDGRSDLERGAPGRHETSVAAEDLASDASTSSGRHGVDDLDPSEVTQKLSVAELAERMGIDPSEMRSSGRRRRRAEAEEVQPEEEQSEDGQAEGSADSGTTDSGTTDSVTTAAGDRAPGRERPGIEPDVEKTTRIVLPPDIRD